ncbi:OLC1v1030845C2 [Oldenlandia corymbosa var. corymbosa]|nr:OLC1v1030845C2 [Oldenlandia corymbosa var. corymbosa]
MEMMRAVSFMYVRPPGYNAESAKAADLADEKKNQEHEQESSSHGQSETGPSVARGEEKKKPRPKDVFGRAVPTEEQFEVLKNAPRLETGVAARSKPFGVEIRNVKCLRCGNYGHQSGDRECPLKDVIMPSEESRLKRDDPLTVILAQTDLNEPLKWELKQKPGLTPPRGGFKPDDPNQQIVAEDIFDEYGGFLGENDISEMLANIHSSESNKLCRKRKHRRKLSPSSRNKHDDPENGSSSSDDSGRRLKTRREKKFRKKLPHSRSEENSDSDMQHDALEDKPLASGDMGNRLKKKRRSKKLSRQSEASLHEADIRYEHRDDRSSSSSDDREKRYSKKTRHKEKSRKRSYSSQSDYSDSDRHRKKSTGDDKERKSSSNKERHKRKPKKYSYSSTSESDYSDHDRHRKRSIKHKHSGRTTSDNSDSEGHNRKKNSNRRRH